MSLPVPDPIETPWLRRGQRGGGTNLARPVQASSFRRDLVLTRNRAHCQRQSAGWNGQAGVRFIGQTGVNLGEVAIRGLCVVQQSVVRCDRISVTCRTADVKTSCCFKPTRLQQFPEQ